MRIEFRNWSRLWHPPIGPMAKHWYKVGAVFVKGRRKGETFECEVVKGMDASSERLAKHWVYDLIVPGFSHITGEGRTEAMAENDARIKLERYLKKMWKGGNR